MKKTVVYSLLFGTMLLGATVPAERRRSFLIANSRLFLPQAQMGRIQ